MTSNDGVVGLKAVIADFRNDFDHYLHFHVGSISRANEASIIEAFTGARILDMCIKGCKLELQNEKDAQCKALQNIAEIIIDKWNATIEELGNTTGLYARNNLIGQIEAYVWTLNVVNKMLQPASKPGQEADNAD